MITINPMVTRAPMRKALFLSVALAATAALTSCANSNKTDTFEKQRTELSYSQTDNKPGADPNNFKAINMAEMLEKCGSGDLEVEKYDNGNIKSKKYYENGIRVDLNYNEEGYLSNTWLYVEDGNIRLDDYYYPNGNLMASNDMSKNTCTEYREDGTPESYHRYKEGNGWYVTSFGLRSIWEEVEEIKYYPNGQMESHWVEDKNKKTIESFYENGTPKSYKVIENGHYTTEEKEYYENGNLKTSVVRKKDKKQTVRTYNEDGSLKTKTISEWNPAHHREYDEDGGYESVGDWVETKHTEHDRKVDRSVQRGLERIIKKMD